MKLKNLIGWMKCKITKHRWRVDRTQMNCYRYKHYICTSCGKTEMVWCDLGD